MPASKRNLKPVVRALVSGFLIPGLLGMAVGTPARAEAWFDTGFVGGVGAVAPALVDPQPDLQPDPQPDPQRSGRVQAYGSSPDITVSSSPRRAGPVPAAEGSLRAAASRASASTATGEQARVSERSSQGSTSAALRSERVAPEAPAVVGDRQTWAYEITLRGMKVADLEVGFQAAGGAYYGEVRSQTRGLARFFGGDTSFEASAQGFMRSDGLWPQSFLSSYTSKKGTTRTETVFDDGMMLDMRMEPQPPTLPRPANWGVVSDPVSFLLDLVRPMSANEVCGGRRSDTFDGLRRITVSLYRSGQSPRGNIVCDGSFVQRDGPDWNAGSLQEIAFKALYVVDGGVAQLGAAEAATNFGQLRIRRR